MSSKFLSFPTLKDFTLYLSDERSIQVSSSIKSRFKVIRDYFIRHTFERHQIRLFLNELRTLKGYKSATLNKYIHVLRLVDLYLGLSILKDFSRYRVLDKDRVPLSDLISDKDMKRLRDVSIKRSRKERETNLNYRTALTLMRFSGIPPVDLCNLKWSMDKKTHLEYYRQKTGKQMLIPIVSKVRVLLDQMRKNDYLVDVKQSFC